jgi:lantibiotic modifying enzyme
VQWEPILRGNVAVEAQNRISSLLAEVPGVDSSVTAIELCEYGLLSGYLAFSETHRVAAPHVTDYLNAASDRVGVDMPSGLSDGLSGIGWIVHHVSARFGECPEPADDPLRDLDQLVLHRLRQNRWSGPYDLISGLVGIGVFFLERLPLATAREGLATILNHLGTLAEESRDGITWHTPARLLPQYQRRECPAGHYNLGVAHGVPGVLYLLCECVAAGVESSKAEYLLNRSLEWFLAQQSSNRPSRYAYWVGPGVAKPARVAWCYGDLGISAVLYQIAKRIGRAELLELATALSDSCIRRSPPVSEPSLCHGALGIAHVLNRFYQTERQQQYRAAARYYYELGLSLLRDSTLDTWMPIDGQREDAEPRRMSRNAWSFLEGHTGIALALLSGVESIEPQWDRRLLLSVCPR